MIESIIVGSILGCLLVCVGVLAWRMRKLEKENKDMMNMVVSSASLLYELSKIAANLQQSMLDHAKAQIIIQKFNNQTQNDLLEFKSNVDKFVTATTQQIQLLHMANKSQKGSGVFGPVKKNDKIKPN